MPELLQQTYELLNQLGAGGGGVVYLARHSRLNKLVALKEDKRVIDKSDLSLRREVDSLKNLNHQYIPQVYDFFQENGKVYTVMDYIEGRSFDKCLEQNEFFTQSQVVQWGKQLLEALCYLHNQKPKGILHADIKPANIMLTPQGDIRLIDFNIALVLGVDGAIAVGRSFGYASPEHYGYYFTKETKLVKGNTKHKRSGTINSETLPSETEYTEILTNNTDFIDEKNNEKIDVGNKTELLLDNMTEPLSNDITVPLNANLTEINSQNITEKLPNITPEENELIEQLNSDKVDRIVYHQVSVKSSLEEHKIYNGYSYVTTENTQIRLDVRSDIYGLGATLYHLLTGERPSKDAPMVRPLDRTKYSHSFIKILEKALEPDPNYRYQTADEMLRDLENIRKNDYRSKALRLVTWSTIVLYTTGFALGGYFTFIGLTRMEANQASKVLAEYSKNALSEGNPTLALDYALQSLPTPDGKFVPDYTTEGQYALSQALGIYEFSEGYHVARTVTLNSEVLGLSLSKDGALGAVLTLGELSILSVASGEILVTLPTVHSALSEFFFVDDTTLFYAGENGVILYDCKNFTPIWTGELGTHLSMSEDGSFFACLYKDESKAFVYDRSGNLINQVDFGDYRQKMPVNDLFANPNDNLFALSNDGSLLAVSFDGGGLMLYDCTFTNEEEKEDFELFDISDFTSFSGGFYQHYFAFACTNQEGTLFAIFDTTDWRQTGGFSLTSKITVSMDTTGLYLSTENKVVGIHPETGDQREIAYTGDSDVISFHHSKDGHVLVLTHDFGYSFYDPLTNLIEKKMEGDDGLRFGAISNQSALMGSLDSALVKILTLENYPENHFASYDSYFDPLEVRVNPDENSIFLFRLDSLAIFDCHGVLLAENYFPEEKDIYDQQFRRDEGHLEVIYYDGTIEYYSIKNGTLLETIQGEEPDRAVTDFFETTNYKIEAPLHGNPMVYDKNGENTNEIMKYIEVSDYLTYVTEIGEQILLEFYSTDGARYGLLCDENLEMIARLPNLTDYKDGYFYFNEGKGSIKREKLYSLDELLSMGESKV